MNIVALWPVTGFSVIVLVARSTCSSCVLLIIVESIRPMTLDAPIRGMVVALAVFHGPMLAL
jgi:hypothetical protein